jgi:hypothetical protein
LIAAPGLAAGPDGAPARRVRLIDATRLRHPGGTGDDWRVHCAYDFTAGRLDEVVVTDQHSAERLAHFTLRPGDLAVADNGYGYRSSVATAGRQGADVVLRITPATFPVETAAGQAFDLTGWLRQGTTASQEWQGWCVHDAPRYAVRMMAARLPPEAAARARQRKYTKAQKQGRTPSAATLTLADGVLVATTLPPIWALSDVRRRYRARWQVELVLKRMKQLLRFNQLRSTQRTTVEATVRALLVAWAVQEDLGAESHTLLRRLTSPQSLVISRWLVTSLGLDTLRKPSPEHLVARAAPLVSPSLTAVCMQSPASAAPSGNGGPRLARRACPAPVPARRKRRVIGYSVKKGTLSSRLWCTSRAVVQQIRHWLPKTAGKQEANMARTQKVSKTVMRIWLAR